MSSELGFEPSPVPPEAMAIRTAARGMFRCVVIGEGTLPVVCGEMLLERGHRIIAMASPDRDVLGWARAKGIGVADAPAGLAQLSNGERVDYLFSITNFQRLPASILDVAECAAINYHDAPLPRYAGSHATSWALLNGETEYAVSWHVMTRRVDGGDILKQVPVDISPDDTALTLNAKCYEAAVVGFVALLGDIEAGALVLRRQDPTQRTFFQRGRRPTPGCTLQFDAPAEHLHALLRALDFGPYPNPLGLPKIALGESFFIVTELEVLDGRSGGPPGTLVSVDADQLVVTTASEDVAVGGLFTMEGVPRAIAEVAEVADLRVRQRVGGMDAGRAARLSGLCTELAGHEPFWLGQLGQARPTPMPDAARPIGSPRRVAHRHVALDPVVGGAKGASWTCDGDRLLGAWLALLARHTDARTIEVAFSDMRLRHAIGDLHGYFAGCVPLRVRCGHDWTLVQLERALARRLQQVRRRLGYSRDLPLRCPALFARREAADTSAWPIAVEIVERLDEFPLESLPAGRVLAVRFAADGRACAFAHDPDALDADRVGELAGQLCALLAALPAHGAVSIRTLPLGEPASLV